MLQDLLLPYCIKYAYSLLSIIFLWPRNYQIIFGKTRVSFNYNESSNWIDQGNYNHKLYIVVLCTHCTTRHCWSWCRWKTWGWGRQYVKQLDDVKCWTYNVEKTRRAIRIDSCCKPIDNRNRKRTIIEEYRKLVLTMTVNSNKHLCTSEDIEELSKQKHRELKEVGYYILKI